MKTIAIDEKKNKLNNSTKQHKNGSLKLNYFDWCIFHQNMMPGDTVTFEYERCIENDSSFSLPFEHFRSLNIRHTSFILIRLCTLNKCDLYFVNGNISVNLLDKSLCIVPFFRLCCLFHYLLSKPTDERKLCWNDKSTRYTVNG